MYYMSYQQIKVGRLAQTFLMEDGPLEIDHRYVKAIEVDMIEVKLARELVVDVRHCLICRLRVDFHPAKCFQLELYAAFFYFGLMVGVFFLCVKSEKG